MTRSAEGASPSPVVDMGEFDSYTAPHRLRAAKLSRRNIQVEWEDGHRAEFPLVWLRDNCACSLCRHPQTRERTFNLIDLPEIRSPRASVTAHGALRLLWAESGDAAGEDHESLYDPGWLRQRADDHGGSVKTSSARLWDAAAMQDRVTSLSHDEVMTTDAGLRRWLDALTRDGVALIHGGPTADGEVLRVAGRVGWPRETNFGRIFDVVSKPDPNNAAYTAIPLEPHVDLPNWQRPPDFQLLYCLENAAQGGASLLTDGFAAAEALRREDPDAYELLATQPVDFRFQDATSDIRFRAPTIGRDGDGAPCEIRFNNWIRDNRRLPPEVAEPFYRAYCRFWALLRDPRFMLRLRLRPGQMVAFDNLRVLHGREAFDPNTGRRHLQGCYLDRDLVMSRLRVLARAA